MNHSSKHLVLIVDDEPMVRHTMTLLLTASGYDVISAGDGFAALLHLKTVTPDLVISDLNMPQMSGFEFLSVLRRRFPEIPVIAVSGAYQSGDHIPGGIIADVFFAKGQHHPADFLQAVAELIRTTTERETNHHRESAPVWIPRNGHDANGVPFIVLTCTECLRSFPLSVEREDVQEIQVTPCLFCANPVRYIIDFSLAISSSKRSEATMAAAVASEERAS